MSTSNNLYQKLFSKISEEIIKRDLEGGNESSDEDDEKKLKLRERRKMKLRIENK